MPTDSRLINWILRVAVALQCAGYAWVVGVVGESPLFAWLWEPRDVGGLDVGELPAVWIARGVAVVLAAAALSALVRPSRVLLAAAVLFQIVYAYAAWQTYSAFHLDVSWAGTGAVRHVADAVVPLLPFAAEAARIAAPAVLLLVHFSRLRKLVGIAITPTTEWLLRGSLALTFAAHGLEALNQRGSFLDMLIVASDQLLGLRMPEAVAHGLLVAIGVTDLTAAVLLVVARWRAVAWYMAAWGLITSAARLIVLSSSVGWYECLVRSSHWALPLVLVLAWRLAPRSTPGVD